MTGRIKELYHKHILSHSKRPFHEGRLEGEGVQSFVAYNPLCGDKFTFYLILDDKQRVSEMSFEGFGCAISRASSSVLVKNTINKTVGEAKSQIMTFLQSLDAENDTPAEDLIKDEELLAFAATREFPEREQCASLGWKAMKEFLLAI
ncbi:MAG: SUF system NifU family Fe-S cluster assembly protein [Cyclobacteriaceae bacterium]|nr:SUF system NifU family Fe-S cluster assembly protein [Cyclobacteriaceae bacterium]